MMRTVLLLSAAAAFVANSPVLAQTVRARVVDAISRNPVAEALVSAVDSAGATVATARTSDAGTFALEIAHPRTLRLHIQLQGYAAYSGSIITITDGRTDLGDIALQPSVTALDSIPARADARDPVLARTGFYDRRQSGTGIFLERVDVARKQARTATDILRGIANVTILRRGGATDILIRATASFRGRTQCTPPIYLNGVLVAFGQSSDARLDLESLRAEDVEAVEIYSGPASIPARFGGAHSACGVVAFWTR